MIELFPLVFFLFSGGGGVNIRLRTSKKNFSKIFIYNEENP